MHKILIGILSIMWAANTHAEVTLADGTALKDSPSLIVTYIEVAGNSAEEAAELIKEHTAASKDEAGNLRFEALQRISRSNHFVLLESWAGLNSRAAHAASAHTVSFREKLQPMLYAPYDERPHVALLAPSPQYVPDGDDSTIYVITHADLIPPEQFAPCDRRPDPNGPCGNDLITNMAKLSRTHDGNLRYDVLTQSNRPNHMTVVEMWQDASAQAAHQSQPGKKAFRDELAGIDAASGVNPDPQFVLNMMTGSLWDERLFRLISIEDGPARVEHVQR
jgi:quinol monooxygenase YgiN